MKLNIDKKEIEIRRNRWSKIAKKNGWYKDNFYIQIWIDTNTNEIIDSVSFIGLSKDIICDYETDEEIN